MIHKPNWRPHDKHRWLGQEKDLKLTFKKNGVAWEESESEGTGGKYVEGMRHITRSREKSQEKGRAEFISTVKADVWGSSVA